ncbi:alcohol dehydrogenase-like regulatory protein ErcA [Archangium lipolyticum]|uniref:alcohol dehydrogenase-like regulatory protein ErcA n=1 Tax=Archangium lipolyticum TaxID=2970465 RepID=UPI00214A5459|nr:alcohol dehydrogenase-like regulatory protein ErcA [Archangium lipolyticum]
MTTPSTELRKFVAPEIVYGPGSRSLVGRYARNLGATRVLVVSDPGVVLAGWLRDAFASLEREGVLYHLFADVSPNPRAQEVHRGVEVYQQEHCDALVAVGGGSPMDCAKGIGIVLANKENILTFEGVDRIARPIPPLVCVPTTAGSSADVSQFAIITDTERRLKVSIISKAIVPDISLVDCDTTRTLTPFLIACSGMDAFVHGIEAFVSNAHSTLTDVYALAAISLIWNNLPAAMENPLDEAARRHLMEGSLEAGLAFSNTSLGAVHAMAHAMGGLVDNPHGEANTLLVDHVVAFNYEAAPERFDLIAEKLGLEPARLAPGRRKEALLTAIRQLKHSSGLAPRLRDKGISRSDIPFLARNALADPCMATNPRRMTLRDVEVLYEQAF